MKTANRRENDKYFELVRAFPLRPIRTEADAEHAIAVTIQQLGEDATLRGVLQGHRFVVEADSVGLAVFASPSAPPPSFVFGPEHWSLLPGDVDI